VGPAGAGAAAGRDAAAPVVLLHAVPEGAGGSARARARRGWATRLGDARVPTTVVCGELDVPFLVSRCEELARALPGARPCILPGTAHLPYLDAPDAVADVIRDALAG
jgi:pimeloyl-ACP methyl ester carboxylesterase